MSNAESADMFSNNESDREARAWVANMNLPCVHGREIDLRGPAQTVKFAGYFRERFFREAARVLKRAGASVILPDD